jgi:hypothetical protein
MYSVSSAYREAIQLHRSQGVRNRSYAVLYIGQFDAAARGDAVLSINDVGYELSEFSKVNSDATQGAAYAAWEKNFFRLDAKQVFLPDDVSLFEEQGFISARISGADGTFDTPIVLTVEYTNLHRMGGITLLFDDISQSFASSFRVDTYLGDTLVETNNVVNGVSKYQGALTLDYHNKMVITFLATTHPYQRLRLQQLLFGIGFVYGNEEITSLSLKRSNSPVSIELPSNKLDFTLFNENGEFAPDSTSSVLAFFSDDQECKLSIGHDIDGSGSIEYVGTGKFWLSEWSANGIEAKFVAADIFERMSATTYRRGTYGSKTAKAVIDDVMLDFGYDNYDADNYELWNTYIINPLPIASHAECLQLIANYAMCTLETDEDGVVIFRRRTDPVPAYVTPYYTERFMLGAVTADLTAHTDPILEYASWEQDGFSVSGDMLLIPDDNASFLNNGLVWDTFPTSYVSSSPAKYQYAPIPVVRIDFAANVSFGSAVIDFGANFVPTYIGLRGYRDDGGSYSIVYNRLWQMDAKRMVVIDNFDRIVWLDIYVVGSDKQQRARIQRVAFSWENGYEITSEDILGNPKGTKLPACRNVIVPLDNRTAEASADIKTATITAGSETWIEYGGMYKDVVITTTTAGATLSYAAYAYAARITASGVTGDVAIKLTGKKLVQGAEDKRIVAINAIGEDCEIVNPLLSASSLKPGYLSWLASHFAKGVEWQAETLGYPELQPGDSIGYKGARASIMDADITYKYSLKERFTLRKEEET